MAPNALSLVVLSHGLSGDCTIFTTCQGESKNDVENPDDPGENSEDTKTPSTADRDNEDNRSEWQKAHSALASACVTCLGNMVAANSTTRKLLWSHIRPHLRHLLTYDDWKVSQMASMILHNCLLENELKIEFSRDKTVQIGRAHV